MKGKVHVLSKDDYSEWLARTAAASAPAAQEAGR
jgi:heme/copper-type cytochrome/quinol oxidase subunit 2